MRLILLVLMISLNTLPFSSDTTDALWMYLTANHAPLVVDDISEDSEKKDEDLTARNSLNLDEGLDQDVAALRRYVEVRLLSMREGEEKLNRKITAILSERHENWQKEYDWFNRQALSLHGEINLYTTLESRIQSFQQARSPEKPKMDQIPEEALDYLANGELSLAMGAPGSGPGFSRACPAEILDGQLIEGSIEPGMADSGSSGLMMPVRGVLSAGTWAYPGGGLHLGMDIAASMYSPLYAPANGVILYAANPVQDGGGYLGNWVGWPFGGGNTIAMICQSGGSLYGVCSAICRAGSWSAPVSRFIREICWRIQEIPAIQQDRIPILSCLRSIPLLLRQSVISSREQISPLGLAGRFRMPAVLLHASCVPNFISERK